MADDARRDSDDAAAGTARGRARVPASATPSAGRRGRPAAGGKARRRARRRAFRALEVIGGIVGVTVLLAGLLASAVHVRLSHGSIPLGLVQGWIEAEIARDMAPWRVRMASASLVRREQRGLEIELAGVELRDSEQRVIAAVPMLRIEPSFDGLWRGRVGAERLAIVGLRMELATLLAGGLGPSTADALPPPVDARSVTIGSMSDAAQAAGASPPMAPPRVDLARLLSRAGAHARDGDGVARGLRSIAFEDVRIALDGRPQGAEWRIPDLILDLEHRQKRSALALEASLASSRGPWRLAVQIDDREKSDLVSADVRIRDLVPRAIVGTHPALAMLGSLSMPVDADARVVLGRDGRLLDVVAELSARRGQILLPGLEHAPVEFEGARVRASFSPDRGHVVFEPSPIVWDGGRATLAGTATPIDDGNGNTQWNYRFSLADPNVGGDHVGEAAVPIEALTLEGSARPEHGRIELTRGQVVVRGGRLDASGWSQQDGADVVGSLTGRMTGMDTASLIALWPRQLAPMSRDWVRANVRTGAVEQGTFEVGRTRGRDGGAPSERAALSLEVQNAEVIVHPSLPALTAPRSLVRIEGQSFEVTVADATMTFARGRRLALSRGRYTVAGIRDPSPLAETAFRVQGPLTAAAKALERVGVITHEDGSAIEGMEGKVDGELRMRLVPPKEGPVREIWSTEGRFRISEVRARNIIAGYHLRNATIDITVDDRTIDARGDLLVHNLPVKLAWQRLLGTDASASPPLRLSMRLDAADRAALGLDIEHWVRGDVPVEITVERAANGEARMRVHAALNGAELHFAPIAWRKTAGRPATLDFEVVRNGQKTEFQAFRLRGEGLAVDGKLVVGTDNTLREIDLPTFSVGVIGSMAVRAVLGNDKVWRVSARGSAFDGQDYFRSLVSGVTNESELPRSAQTPAKRRETEVVLDLQIEQVIGFHDTPLRGFFLRARQRGARISALEGRGILEGGAPLTLALVRDGGSPRVVVTTSDAGRALKLIGLYSAMSGGSAELALDLDEASGRAARGALTVRNFALLGQPVVADVAPTFEETATSTRPRATRRVVRETITFDRMHLPFRLEPGAMTLTDTRINGPLIGATLRGRIGLADHRLALHGTFTPLRGINAALSQIPLLGELLTGSRGEGIIAINFALRGSLEEPEVIVHPLSPMAPGILRELFQLGPDALGAGGADARGPGNTDANGARSRTPPASSIPPPPRPSPGRVLDGWSTESHGPRPVPQR